MHYTGGLQIGYEKREINRGMSMEIPMRLYLYTVFFVFLFSFYAVHYFIVHDHLLFVIDWLMFVFLGSRLLNIL
jgi:hypothetical protein